MLPLLSTLVVSALAAQAPRCADSVIAAAKARAEDWARTNGCTGGCFLPTPAPGKPVPIPTVADLLTQVDAVAQRCQAGDIHECTRLGRRGGYAPLVTCGARAYARACAAGSAVDCLDLSELYAGWPGASRIQKARAAPLRRRGIAALNTKCDGGSIADCATLLGRLSPIREDTAQARIERRLCELGNAFECAPAADRDGVRSTAAGARLLERGCFAERPSGLACYFLAEAYRGGRGVPTDTTKARDLRRRACDLERTACGPCAPYGCVKQEVLPPARP